MEEAIARGDIAWHALPFTWQTEMLDPSMIEGSLAISRSLDRRFGVVTTGAKMTDVPGHTRGIIAPLAKHGVGLLEIGVNGGSTAAQLPPLFLWKDPCGASLPMMYHWDYERDCDCSRLRSGGSDEGAGRQQRTAYCGGDCEDPCGSCGAVPEREDYGVQLERHGECYCAASRQAAGGDRGDWRYVDSWVRERPAKGGALSGSGAAAASAGLRLGGLRVGERPILQLLRHVLLEAEHTWGTDTKTWLDFDNYMPADLARMLDTKKYKVVEFSWIEKRQDLLDGIATLPEALREEACSCDSESDAGLADAPPKAIAHAAGTPIETAHLCTGYRC